MLEGMDNVVFAEKLRADRDRVNTIIEGILAENGDFDADMRDAMRYVLCGGGKRIRGVMAFWGCEAVCGEVNSDAEAAAVAIEMVHTYSLVHDDLPAMDDDDMRRGRATCHKVFGEAGAILAGDALLTLSFGHLARKVTDSAKAVRMIGILADAAGAGGMIAGQAADIRGEKQEPSRAELEYIHVNKTAKMIQAAVLMGGVAGGCDEKIYGCLGEYGLKTGLAFQVADDILDVTASSEKLGKTAGKDASAGKMTYPALVGLKESRMELGRLSEEAMGSLMPLGDGGEMLISLARFLIGRES
jgi:geranylgeranyl pyrophosphate synthase